MLRYSYRFFIIQKQVLQYEEIDGHTSPAGVFCHDILQ